MTIELLNPIAAILTAGRPKDVGRCMAAHLESCTPGTRQYKVVRTGTYQYILFWIRGGTRNVKIVHTSTYRYVRTHDISMAVHTGMYRYVLFGTRRYEQVQGGTWWYKEQYKEVRDSMYWYVLVCTGMYFAVQGGTSKYKEVHGGTRNSTRRYKTVCTGMYWYVLVCTNLCGSTRLCCPAAGFAAAILPGR